MSARPIAVRPRRRASAAARRRRLAAIAATVLVAALAASLLFSGPSRVVQEVTLPLRHDDVIRQQAADKGLDAALIAGVIYAESRFRDQTSPAGAKGLMQITPETARFIARRSGGTAFELRDLATPQINIAYGSYYLNYLLGRYEGEELPALAAYNAGGSNVDAWIARERAAGRTLTADRIPFPETRQYVGRVLDARAQYRERYPRELGLR